jgi:hypothetical protein
MTDVVLFRGQILEKTDKGTASPEVEGEETKELDKLMFVGRPEYSYLCSN